MFAWILNTKPVKDASSGATSRLAAAHGRGGGAFSMKPSSISCTPKLVSAEPKYTGVKRPAEYSSRSKAWLCLLYTSRCV